MLNVKSFRNLHVTTLISLEIVKKTWKFMFCLKHEITSKNNKFTKLLRFLEKMSYWLVNMPSYAHVNNSWVCKVTMPIVIIKVIFVVHESFSFNTVILTTHTMLVQYEHKMCAYCTNGFITLSYIMKCKKTFVARTDDCKKYCFCYSFLRRFKGFICIIHIASQINWWTKL